MAGSSEDFREAMERSYKACGFTSLRDAEQRTGLNFALIGRMRKGEIPGLRAVTRWADAVGEPRDEWVRIALAGREEWLKKTLNTDAAAAEKKPVEKPAPSPAPSPAQEKPARKVPPPILPAAIPQELHAAIAAAPTRERMIDIAINYLYLRSEELGIEAFGADKAFSYEAKLQIIRAAEEIAGVRLLPPEVF